MVLILSLACQKKEKLEFISPQSGKGLGAGNLHAKLYRLDKEKISLDDEVAVESINPDKSEASSFIETKTTSLNVTCEVPGVGSETKKSRLTRNKKYQFLQLVPRQLLSKNKLNFLKNFSCLFSFSFQKNKIDSLPLIIDNTNYTGNLPLRKGVKSFPKDASDIILPNQLNDIQFDFPSGRAVTTTLICDKFVSREDLPDIHFFQLSRLVHQAIKSANSPLSGAQNCRLVIEALDASEEIFISKSFLLVFAKENLAIDLSSGFSTMSKVSPGPKAVFTLIITNPNDFAVELQVAQLPQQMDWQPVYGVKNGGTGGPVYVMRSIRRVIKWSLTEASGAATASSGNFILAPQQRGVLTGSIQFDLGCPERFYVPSYGPEVPIIGYMLELDSDKLELSESILGATIERRQYQLAGPLQPSFAGSKKWIAVDGVDYTQRFNWFRSGDIIYRGVDSEGTAIKHCTDPN